MFQPMFQLKTLPLNFLSVRKLMYAGKLIFTLWVGYHTVNLMTKVWRLGLPVNLALGYLPLVIV